MKKTPKIVRNIGVTVKLSGREHAALLREAQREPLAAYIRRMLARRVAGWPKNTAEASEKALDTPAAGG